MKNIRDILVVVQARLSSTRVPKKMIRPFANTSLTEIAVAKLLKSKVIEKEQFLLSVHENELVEIGKKYGVNIFHRSEKSAFWDGGAKSKLSDMYEWWNKTEFKYVVLVSACAPLLTIERIDEFIKAYAESDSDGMFGVLEKKNYFWNLDGEMLNKWPPGEPALNTQAVEVTHEAAHCLYAGKMEDIGNEIWMGDFSVDNQVELFPLPEEECFDIDYPWQFDLCEVLYKNMTANNEGD